jgi:DNA-damage-inducible protein D
MDKDDSEARIPHASPFEAIRKIAEDGSEYWNARELAKILGYARWDKFKNAIERAEEACQNSGQAVGDHFSHVGKMIDLGKGAKRNVDDVFLSRYACYLIRTWIRQMIRLNKSFAS